MNELSDPRVAQTFRFVRRDYADGVASLVYAFDDGPEMVERIVFPDAPAFAPERAAAFEAALDLLHLVAGVSYYKAGVPSEIRVESTQLDAATVAFLDALYLHGLGEFAYHNKLDLRGRIRFPVSRHSGESRSALQQPKAGHPAPLLDGRKLDPGFRRDDDLKEWLIQPPRTLVPIGGGKDSLVSVEILKRAGEDATAVWVGNSPLIAACAERTGLPMLNIRRELSPLLFEYNRQGAYNGHIPVTAINSAILAVAAVLYGYDAIAFSNERSASSATLEYDGQPVNHQWSKSWEFERTFHDLLHARVAAGLDYFSLLRPLSELAVAERFARTSHYDDAFSSCNRNFRILGPKPADRWCGQCPKCHFVFLALAPFMPKPRLLGIFGRNLLDDATLAPAFDALMEYRDHKPFECVGEGVESRAAMATLATRAEWREDALVARFADEILPLLDRAELDLDALIAPAGEHRIPGRLLRFVDAHR
ncbi:UDP-N-acetyl-alpha-D-muramoyl-L-alanyl-L-glutamate epimerase [Dokdonella soli]|uniref:UDP-N-acetyl-alpha-D-muramoyl-L-alanyl-L-glutamate epimerase n=1 Tax=Dokdonella soli TaxID=529810 RepID=A0ABP3U7Q5_9GAMM